MGKGRRQLKDLGFVKTTSRILGCQTEAADPLARSWQAAKNERDGVRPGAWEEEYEPVTAGETIATATRIGSPVSYKKVMREVTLSNGVMQAVSEQELAEGMFACASDGHLLCPQTGIAIAGVRRAVALGYIKKGESVLIVSTATGLKFAPVYESGVSRTIERAPDGKTSTVAKMLGM